MKLHPIFSKQFYKWWIIIALFIGLTYSLLGLPTMEGYEKYGLVFWILSTLFTSLILGSIVYLIYRLFAGKWDNKVYIKIIAIASVFATFLYLRDKIFDLDILFKHNDTNSEYFEKSFKEQENKAFSEHLDSTTNIYSNFKYHVAFDAPDNWKTDAGVSEHTIFRAYQPDSLLTFSINVVELKSENNEKNQEIDFWEFYQKNKEQMDYPFTTVLEKQLKTTINNFVCTKSYLQNNICLRRELSYSIKNLDYEYDVKNISLQTLIGDFTYTFGLTIPSLFYNQTPEYYDNLFQKIYFLKDGELLNDIIKNHE
ncbi:MAG: hypothetical protein JXL97_15090 [Bacteroidales bacterium]|nr:hypothetical protein [Bacteroidales bacterium]